MSRSEPGDDSVAGLWSSTLQSIVARAAHEINNALNGAIVNVEVVRARARPGVDGGAAATFADAAASQLDESATLVGALLSLSRAPRGDADLVTIVRDVVTLVAPAARHAGVRIEARGGRSAPTASDATAARLAVAGALLVALEAAASAPAPPGGKVESAGPESADEPGRPLRCTTSFDERPMVEVAPRYGGVLPPHVERALARAGIAAAHEPDSLRLAFPPTAGP